MILYIFYLLVQSVAKIPDEFACEAPPLVFGPICKSPEATEGWSKSLIKYEMIEIISSTSIECYGWGISSVLSCDQKQMGWYPLGILKEGDDSTLYWGANIDYPAIKCKGIPELTGIKWKYSLINDQDTKSCCGTVLYDTYYKICCGNQIYDPYLGYSCCGNLPYKGDDALCCGDGPNGRARICSKNLACCRGSCMNKGDFCCEDGHGCSPGYKCCFSSCCKHNEENDDPCCGTPENLICLKKGEKCCRKSYADKEDYFSCNKNCCQKNPATFEMVCCDCSAHGYCEDN